MRSKTRRRCDSSLTRMPELAHVRSTMKEILFARDARAYLDEFGDIGFGTGGAFELGVDFKRFGVSVEIDAGAVSFDRESPSFVDLSLLGH